MKNKEFNEYDDQIVDTDEVLGTDLKINPDYYIHTAILKAQKSLEDDNVQRGHLKFRIFVEHIEGLCSASKMLTDEYREEIEKYKKSESYINSKDNTKEVKLANKKMQLILKNVFANKTVIDKLTA